MNGSPAPAPEPNRRERLRRVGYILLTLGLGVVGGYLFLLAALPLPWMMGAMCVTTIAALTGVPLRAPDLSRAVMIAVIGLMVGSAFTPDVLGRALQWLPSLAMLLVFTVTTVLVLGWGLCRFGGFSPADAFCSTAPGGFTEMVLLGGAMGGDERIISLMHSVRILITVMVIPFWFRIFHGYVPGGTAVFGSIRDLTPDSAAVLLACGLVGYFVAAKLRVPLPFLVGPMVASAAVHVFGFSTARPPGELVALAQVVIGVGVGCRFMNTPLSKILFVFKIALAMTLCMLTLAILFAYGLHVLTGLSFEALILAFSPGGVAEMNVITVTLNIDPVFVAAHHLVRLGFLLILAPLILRLFLKKIAPAGK